MVLVYRVHEITLIFIILLKTNCAIKRNFPTAQTILQHIRPKQQNITLFLYCYYYSLSYNKIFVTTAIPSGLSALYNSMCFIEKQQPLKSRL